MSPVKPSSCAQQAREDRPAERRRQALGRVERGQPDVRRHHGVDARGDRRPERHELHGVEASARVLDHREVEVGVGRRVAVAGEVLGGREHAALLDPAHVGRRHARHELGVLAERADADHRVLRIHVHVDHRVVVHVDAERPALARADAARALGERRVARRAERHRARHARRALHDVAGAALEVGGEQQRQRGGPLQAVEQRRDRERVALDRPSPGGP